MKAAFVSFMHKMIDYAGLFPPAKLPMNEAFSRYVEYRKGQDSWMLARFVCPASRLTELQTMLKDQAVEEAMPLSLILTAEPPDLLEAGFSQLKSFLTNHRHQVTIASLEMKMPPALQNAFTRDEWESFLQRMNRQTGEAGICPEHLFLEVPLSDFSNLKKLLEGISASQPSIANQMSSPHPALKIRCGGEQPEMYPTPVELARAIQLCREQKVPFKATAGLHHPVRHFHPSAGVTMHGFFNIFGAAILSYHHSLPLETVQAIIEDENVENFQFSDEQFSWQGITVNCQQIEEARSRLAISFGSCSFDEPREDLRSLGLLP